MSADEIGQWASDIQAEYIYLDFKNADQGIPTTKSTKEISCNTFGI